MRTFFRQVRPAITTVLVATVLCGVLYPLLITGIGQIAFRHRANGSLIERDGKVVGSSLIGQSFNGSKYFHPRPSAAGAGYDGTSSSGSNLGPSSEELLTVVRDRVQTYRSANGIDNEVAVPVDAVTSSGSGLDPEISVANARMQAARVAKARSLPTSAVLKAINDAKVARSLGFLGDEGVNVLTLNLSLDALSTGK